MLLGALAVLSFACGGKLAPLRGMHDASDDPQAEAAPGDDAGLLPVVDRITPEQGPNVGGTTVTIVGSGFDPDGGTEITFANAAATGVSCTTSHQCVAVSPFAGYQPFAQVAHVQATVGGTLGDPAAHSSETRAQDQFTYTAGPACTTSLMCSGIYFPDLHIDCPSILQFYEEPRTQYQAFVDAGTSIVVPTDDSGETIAACFGGLTDSSCTLFSAYEAQWSYCGAGGGFCDLCMKCGGVCTMTQNGPVCSKMLGGPEGCLNPGGGGG